ncbi:uncharacterized protein FMAN_02274 [Fusarium mangiferae]|uniref:F-box domain-containing protein n=1 Tax=Fusarium mangiferae TaxID=192010 RepID=A0A1L7TRI3_FUSMA|nr:uncharacterized protein FMAN_02274 [Fusarium mangiferae]CVK99432.1 uncharacterized protein FMAN_02274 [Fusarium mangiferae]
MTANDGGRGSSGLFGRLPAEVLNQILCELHNIDLKNLRQTCTYFKDVRHLRLNRLFLSPNLHDIEVFRAVADHKALRLQVTEIIYDDARFDSAHEMEWFSWYDEERDIGETTGVPEWYCHVYRENRNMVEWAKPRHPQVKEAFEHLLSPAEAFKHFKRLWQKQQDTIATNRDADALKYGLLRFPNLKRVVVSPAAHGKPGLPWYLTPTIRSLPRGLLYPIERGWPLTRRHSNFPEARNWDSSEKDKWRGYCLVSRIIAQHLRENPESKLADLAIDTNQLRTGISCRIFDDAENSEIKDLKTILSHPGFVALDLSLHCGNQCNMNWCSFRSNHLRKTLSKARDIQHFSLLTNVAYVDDFDYDSDDPDGDGEEGDHFIPLHSIFPVNDWHQLRHFGLCRFIVKKDDVIEFLGALPPTLESVELSFFIFMPDSGDYHSLVHDMREKLGWRGRDSENQPKIVVRVDVRRSKIYGAVMMDVSREVTNFMYEGGENPFSEDEGCVEEPYIPQSDTPEGNGRLLDAFDPSFEEPNVSLRWRLGRSKCSPEPKERKGSS